MANFLEEYKKEFPKVAATLTTALILFVVSTLAFPPIRALFFGTEAQGYPLVCTVEPVPRSAEPPEVMEADLFVINTSPDRLTGMDLRNRLDSALEGTGLSGDPRITLRRRPDGSAIIDARSDPEFNAGKGVLGATHGPDGVVVTVTEIGGISVLRAKIFIADGRPREYSRAESSSLPFPLPALRALGESCYTRLH